MENHDILVATIHSNQENISSNFEIAEDPINRYTNQIVVNIRKQNVACTTEKVKIIFRNIQRIYSIDQDRTKACVCIK